MSKKHLQAPQNNIPQVDGQLEEDSVRASDNSALAKVKTDDSAGQFGDLQISRLEVTLGVKNLEDKQLPQSDSVVLEGSISQSRVDQEASMLTSGINVSMLNQEIEIDMGHDIEEYFLQYKYKGSILNEKQQRWIHEANYKIRKLIKSGDLNINSNQRQLYLKTNKQHAQHKKTIEQLESKKHGMIQQLKEIDEEEARIRIQHKQLRIKQGSRSKFTLTENDRKNLMTLIKVKKQFEKSLEKKDAELKAQEKTWKQDEKQKRKEIISIENEKKKEKILKKLKDLQASFHQRQQGLKQSVLRRKQKYAYKVKEQQWEQIQKQQSQEISKKLKALEERHKIDIKQIKQHERKYSQCLEKRASEHVSVEHHRIPKREKTHFDKLVQQELFEAKENNYKKSIKALQNEFRNKIISFQQKIDKDYKPKNDPSKTMVVPLPRSFSTISLTKEKRVEKGLSYLAKAKQLKKSPSVSIVKTENSPEVYGNKAYKNYLEDRPKVQYSPLKKQFKEMMRNDEKLNNYQSVIRAKNLAEGLSAFSKREGDNRMYFSIKTKLKLLENINTE